ILNTLGLNIVSDISNRKLYGFLFTKNNNYRFDLENGIFKSSWIEYNFQSKDFIIGPLGFYLRVDLFEKLLNIKAKFSFSELQVYIPLNKNFPEYKRLQRKKAKDRLKIEITEAGDVRKLPYKREYFTGGVVDWILSANAAKRSVQYYNFHSGGLLMGGDFDIAGGGSTKNGFDSEQVRYRWHYYYKDSPYISQANIGYLYAGGSLSRGLKGGMVTNKPQVQREYFQTIRLSEYIGENWEVELYVDNRLTDYQETDQNGFYNFTVDIYYGSSQINLKMYGPNGEIKESETFVRIPYNLIPKKHIEYSAAAGAAIVPDNNGKYMDANVYYGITEHLTAGMSSDIPLTPRDDENAGAAFEATFLALGNLTLNTSLSPKNEVRFAANFNMPSLININADYSKHYANKYRNPFKQIHGFGLSASSPLKIGRRYLGLRYYFSWDKYESSSVINMNFGFSASIHKFHLNYTGLYRRSEYASRTINDITSRLFSTVHLYRWIRPQFRIDYDHSKNEFSRIGIYLTKRMFTNGQLTLSYQRNMGSESDAVMLNLNIFSGFASFASKLGIFGKEVSLNQIQRGSIRYDQSSRSFRFDRRNGVGYGSALVRPFLDANFNGILDEGEKPIPGLKARLRGGRETYDTRRSMYYYDGLRPYDEYSVKIDHYSLDDPSLKPTNENYKVSCNPNMVTSIDVPLVTASEINGRIERRLPHGDVGIGGIILVLLNIERDITKEVTAFTNGDYYYYGLIPGKYRAFIDPVQLNNYGYISEPPSVEFEIIPTEQGTTLDNVNFLLLPR
ncbi:MAG: hypothetical protein GY855_17850, partial [candidate division Zixibacteria bacterium]|nr:hypothetical protein [candidate division Zixibacteria bacterium]